MPTRLITYGAALTMALLLAASASAGIAGQIRKAFGPAHDDTALCIASRESTGELGHFNPSAVSPTNDHGLFQINGIWFGQVVRYRDRVKYVQRRWIYNATYNIEVAWIMSRGGSDWSPWTGTFGRGACHGLS